MPCIKTETTLARTFDTDRWTVERSIDRKTHMLLAVAVRCNDNLVLLAEIDPIIVGNRERLVLVSRPPVFERFTEIPRPVFRHWATASAMINEGA